MAIFYFEIRKRRMLFSQVPQQSVLQLYSYMPNFSGAQHRQSLPIPMHFPRIENVFNYFVGFLMLRPSLSVTMFREISRGKSFLT